MEVGAILFLFLSGLVLGSLLILYRQRRIPPGRSLLAFQGLQQETGYAAESGGAVHIALGSGELYEEDAITSLAGLQALEAMADAAVSYRAPPVVTVGDPTLLPLAQDVLRRAYERSGRADLYRPSRVRFVAPSPIAYTAGAAHVVATERITANAMIGAFGPEVSLIADASARRDLPQLAAVADPRAIGALYPATDRLAMGEELYTASAQMTEERYYAVSLIAHDVLRIILVLIIAGAVLWPF